MIAETCCLKTIKNKDLVERARYPFHRMMFAPLPQFEHIRMYCKATSNKYLPRYQVGKGREIAVDEQIRALKLGVNSLNLQRW